MLRYAAITAASTTDNFFGVASRGVQAEHTCFGGTAHDPAYERACFCSLAQVVVFASVY
jgi:hypothetical protein